MQCKREEGEVLFRTTLHHHSHAHSSTTSSSSITTSPSDGSRIPRSPTPPRPYLAPGTPRNPHTNAEGALAFPRSAYLSQTVSSLCCPLMRIERRTRMAVGWKWRGWEREVSTV